MKKALLLLTFCSLSTSICIADEVVKTKINMTQVLVEDSKDITDPYFSTKDDPSCSKCPPLTLGMAASHALMGSYEDERGLDGEQKWARGVLADKIKNDASAILTASDVILIKRLLGKMFGVVIIKAAYPLLDPNAVPPAIK